MAACSYFNVDISIRRRIIDEIAKRNLREKEPFEVLISTYNRLFELVSELRHEILQLTIQNEKFRQESMQLQGHNVAVEGKTPEKTLALDMKIFHLQEELTNLHRRKGEHTQQIVDLTSKLQETEKILASKDSQLLEAEHASSVLREEKAHLETTISETEAANQILRDEHQALQIAFASLEEKVKQLQVDNSDLVERLISYKAHDADVLNRENENFVKIKQAQVQKELEDAASEVRIIAFDKSCHEPQLPASSLPSKIKTQLDAHEGGVNALSFNSAARLLATGGGDRKVKLWDYGQSPFQCKATLPGSNAGVTSVEFDSAGTMMLAASNDFASRVWTVGDQRLRHTLTGHTGKVLAARFFADASIVVTGSHDRTLKVWDLRSRNCIATKFAGSSCNDLVTIDGVQIISGHYDKTIRFWDQRSESSRNEIILQGKVTSLDTSGDKNYLLACVRDDTLVTIDLRMSQKIVSTYSHDNFKVGCDWTRAAFSHSGQYIAVGSSDGGVFIFNVASTKVERYLKEHSSAVIAVAWDPCDQYLASCDKIKRVVIWSA